MRNLFEKECEYCGEKFEDIFPFQDVTNQKIVTHIVKCEEKQRSEKIQSCMEIFS